MHTHTRTYTDTDADLGLELLAALLQARGKRSRLTLWAEAGADSPSVQCSDYLPIYPAVHVCILIPIQAHAFIHVHM